MPAPEYPDFESIVKLLVLINFFLIGTTLYRPRRTGERKRKSVRGCICGPDLAALFLRVLEKGPGEVTGLTDAERPRRLGPKRANKIRAAFGLRKRAQRNSPSLPLASAAPTPLRQLFRMSYSEMFGLSILLRGYIVVIA